MTHERATAQSGRPLLSQAPIAMMSEERNQLGPEAYPNHGTALLQRFGGDDLEQGAGENAVARHNEEVAQLDRRRADHHIAAGDSFRRDAMLEQVARRNARYRLRVDRIVDAELTLRGGSEVAEDSGNRRNPAATQPHAERVGSHDAIGIEVDVDRRQGRHAVRSAAAAC